MTIHAVFVVRDVCVDTYMIPMFFQNRAAAVRALGDAVNKASEDNQFTSILSISSSMKLASSMSLRALWCLMWPLSSLSIVRAWFVSSRGSGGGSPPPGRQWLVCVPFFV